MLETDIRPTKKFAALKSISQRKCPKSRYLSKNRPKNAKFLCFWLLWERFYIIFFSDTWHSYRVFDGAQAGETGFLIYEFKKKVQRLEYWKKKFLIKVESGNLFSVDFEPSYIFLYKLQSIIFILRQRFSKSVNI